MAGLSITMTIGGDRMLFERTSERLRNPRPFFEQIGVLGMSSAIERLDTVLSSDADATRSGRLKASLKAGPTGTGGSEHTIFELGDHYVEYGSNLVYAAQVHHGGIIEPRTAKALAIPLPAALKRAGLSPRDLDPNREILRFVPYTGSKPNIIGLLIDDAIELTGRQRKKKGSTPYGPGPLFALAYWVSQPARPFLYLDAEDRRTIVEELWPEFLAE